MTFFKKIKQNLTSSYQEGYSLEMRFIITFLVLLITFIFSISMILAALGVFSLDQSKPAALLEHELNNISDQIYSDYNVVTSSAIHLTDNLSSIIKNELKEKNIEPGNMAKHPEILNDLLQSMFATMTTEIKPLKSSGVFLILDATINPEIDKAHSSRAGIFIKNIAAQSNLSATYSDLRYLYGPISLAQIHKMPILPQWSLEYDIRDMDIFNIVMKNAKANPEKSLSQLYYWTMKESDGGVDHGMYCSVPLIIDGIPIGVCGYEVSTMQFKLAYAPEITGQNYSFCMLAPSDNDQIYFEKAMFAGNYAVSSEQPTCTTKKPRGDGLLKYECESAGIFVGKHTDFSLYPTSSTYAQHAFSVVLLTPNAQLMKINHENNLKYIGVFFSLFLITGFASIILCQRNMKPVKNAIDAVRKGKSIPNEKIKIKEIDDLFDFLADRDREHEEQIQKLDQERQQALEQGLKANAEVEIFNEIYGNEITPAQYADFTSRLQTLTPKETQVYNLYLEGKRAPEIATALGISINTIKYHNKNIYDKLDINSRKELLRYAKHM